MTTASATVCQSTKSSADNYKLTFGQYRGRSLREVPTSYLSWLAGQSGLYQETRDALSRYLAQPQPTPPQPERPAELLDRMPPADIEAEKCLIGSLFIRPQLLPQTRQIVTPADFYFPVNGLIYEHMNQPLDRSAPDILLVRYRLKRAGKFDEVGDAYLAECALAVPTPRNAEEYARIVREKSLLRKLIATAKWMLKACYDDVTAPEEIAAEATRRITTGEQT